MSRKRKTPPPSVEKDGDDAVFLSGLYRNIQASGKPPAAAKKLLGKIAEARERYLGQLLTNESLETIHDRLHEFHELSGGGDFVRGVVGLASGEAHEVPEIHCPKLAANARNGIWAAEVLAKAATIREAASLGFLLGQSLANCRALQRDGEVLRGIDMHAKRAGTRPRGRKRNEDFWEQIWYAWGDYCGEADNPIPGIEFLKWLRFHAEDYQLTVEPELEENPEIIWAGKHARWDTVRKKIKKMSR